MGVYRAIKFLDKMIGHASLPIAVKWVQRIIYWFSYKVFNSALDVEFQVNSLLMIIIANYH